LCSNDLNCRNKRKFLQYQKEIKDREGRYIIVKGTIDKTKVTLVNIYAPPENGKYFFGALLDLIAVETDKWGRSQFDNGL